MPQLKEKIGDTFRTLGFFEINPHFHTHFFLGENNWAEESYGCSGYIWFWDFSGKCWIFLEFSSWTHGFNKELQIVSELTEIYWCFKVCGSVSVGPCVCMCVCIWKTSQGIQIFQTNLGHVLMYTCHENLSIIAIVKPAITHPTC